MLNYLRSKNIGWVQNIENKLHEYNLETDYEIIKAKSKEQWKKEVEKAVNKRNFENLIDHCTHETPVGGKINTKTKYIYDILMENEYIRRPLPEILRQNKLQKRSY